MDELLMFENREGVIQLVRRASLKRAIGVKAPDELNAVDDYILRTGARVKYIGKLDASRIPAV